VVASLTGRLREPVIARDAETPELERLTAVFVAAWQEADVIGAMIAHTLKAWPQRRMALYVGCYRERSCHPGGGDGRCRA
jgi:adsorption protein B